MLEQLLLELKDRLSPHDQKFGESLLSQMKRGYSLSPKQLDCIIQMFAKYGVKVNRESLKQPYITKKIFLEGDFLIFQFTYDVTVKEQVKELGARYNPEEKRWYLPKDEAYKVANLSQQGWEIDQSILEIMTEEVNTLDSSTLDLSILGQPLPDGRKLYIHQQEAIQWAIKVIGTRHRGGILALDMGLGKTLVSLVTAKIYKQNYPDMKIFVICPASLKENWLREAKGIGVEIEVFSWNKQPEIPNYNYFLIVDEAHYAQSGTKSQRGKKFLELCRSTYCKAKLLLTGTPMKNGRPINLLPLLQAIRHPIVDNRREYEKRYCAAKRTRWCPWDTSGASNLGELQEKIRDFVFRRTKRECLDLPEKIRVFVPVEVSNTVMEEYNKAKKAAIDAYNPYENGAALVLMSELRKAASKAKIEHAIRMVEELLEQGEQVVIFTEFIETAKTLHQKLGGCLLIGETPQHERQALVDLFQSGQEKIFISTSGAGGVGINLTAAQSVILIDRPLTSGDVAQCEDRCHRIGAKGAVICYWLQFDSIDTKIDKLLAEKQKRIDLVLEGKRKTMRGVSSNPLDYLQEIAKEIVAEKK